MITIELPLKVVSEGNAREHWRARHGRRAKQRQDINLTCSRELANVSPPCSVKFTRIAPRCFDTDNLASSFKAVRDEISALLGVDDGRTDLIRFEYDQRKGKPKEYGIVIEVQPM